MVSSNSNQPNPPSDQTPATPHTNILQQAKQTQQQDLKQSATYIKQLHTITNHLILSNSNSDPLTTKSNLLDKITTIHQLNNNIDHQLNDEISSSYYNMMKVKQKVTKISQGCRKRFDAMNEVVNLDDIDTEIGGISGDSDDRRNVGRSEFERRSSVARLGLQKRCELIDQDLRILEHTLKLKNERD
ncbi:hypothetical protein CORT_0A08690 [Candida orthopsilosis Co 90-125]|uniref:Uncharacterized protein n=1 Tax=Candida orthopsilosis (strain 90-125) TaxID=1136231 RepID=H8WYD8_CANO9|nr:hypothetical protein CORT_0A08690 [Candida orthopsilosis Co 90-125]CCG21253.1 hypothetical protein CORT_0A08690 [Candida orthopsilosis Co 90-125]